MKLTIDQLTKKCNKSPELEYRKQHSLRIVESKEKITCKTKAQKAFLLGFLKALCEISLGSKER